MEEADRSAAGPSGAGGKTAKEAPEKTSPSAEEKEPGSDRLLGALPFFFGGGLSLLLAFTLRREPTRSGVPPLWVLFLMLGLIALVAGILLLLAREGEDEDEHEPGPEEVVVSKEEWERVQHELRKLRQDASTPTATAKSTSQNPSTSPPPSEEKRPAAAVPPEALSPSSPSDLPSSEYDEGSERPPS